MAENNKQGRSYGNRRQQQPSRLQRRAPASIQISRATDWNAAIPLLSPLITSPTNNLTADINKCGVEEAEKQPIATASFKKWQHPAAPFFYEPAPFVPFVCTAGVDRR